MVLVLRKGAYKDSPVERQLFYINHHNIVSNLTTTTISKLYQIHQLNIIIMSGNDNPGNFANRPKEEVKAAAQKGGEHSHSGGFASMDADKQREIASKGGKASSGNFEPGSEKAKEAGRKGGQAS
ncbi:Conidiation-specific protein 10 [Pyrenophora tritici-repentis]|nr:Conidiation-specific protein 10 [Pyrenophora tritici-repentis]KAI0581538.1 Conidiation-specific protein 10 [Pyrenophora tritici-repentis]KAI0621207.1 Conidiation-specific protein 10 [Pyrenophora tritici-repentis]KAI1537399.1 GsiB General stress protein [Pyrenophora tritici-repentis]KAI1582783.1 GsiB General stress protein [Pyrenophora tritici-repentis]